MKKLIVLASTAFLLISCQDDINVTIQQEPGFITGQILPAGVNAQVELYQGNLISEETVDASGYFTFEEVSPGTYSIRANAQGYGTHEMYKIHVDDGEGFDVGVIELSKFPSPLHYVYPYDGATGVELNYYSGLIQLAFKKHMDIASVVNAFSVEPSVENIVVNSGSPRPGTGGSSSFYVSGDFNLGTQYTFTIDTTAQTVAGEVLEFAYTSSFTTENFRVTNFTFNSRPPNTGNFGNFPVAFYFNSPVDPFHFMENLTVNPPIELTSTQTIQSRIQIQPILSWIPDTTYTFSISENLQETGGASLTSDTSFSMAIAPLVVDYTDPYDNQHFVPTYHYILVQFNNLIDEASIPSAISIMPPVNYTLSTDVHQGMSRFTLDPDSLAEATVYTVTIDTSLKDFYGGNLAAPYTFDFVTE